MPEPHPDAPVTPMPVPPGTPLILLIGGTFDPPHRAHVELPLRARAELERREGCPGRAHIVYIPAARSPHKGTGPVASEVQRIEMLRLALLARDRTGVWTDEIDRANAAPGTPSYTIDTLRRARRWLDTNANASAKLRLLIGADQALAFHRWREPRHIIAIAEPAVILRPPVASADQLFEALRASGAWSEDEIDQWRTRLVDVGVIDATATSVRSMLATTSPDASRLHAMLDDRVLDYITSHHLYAPAAHRPTVAPPPGPVPG